MRKPAPPTATTAAKTVRDRPECAASSRPPRPPVATTPIRLGPVGHAAAHGERRGAARFRQPAHAAGGCCAPAPMVRAAKHTAAVTAERWAAVVEGPHPSVARPAQIFVFTYPSMARWSWLRPRTEPRLSRKAGRQKPDGTKAGRHMTNGESPRIIVRESQIPRAGYSGVLPPGHFARVNPRNQK